MREAKCSAELRCSLTSRRTRMSNCYAPTTHRFVGCSTCVRSSLNRRTKTHNCFLEVKVTSYVCIVNAISYHHDMSCHFILRSVQIVCQIETLLPEVQALPEEFRLTASSMVTQDVSATKVWCNSSVLRATSGVLLALSFLFQ